MRIGNPQNHNGNGLITGISAINSASIILSDATVLENGSNVTLSNHDGAIVINAELGAIEQEVSSKVNKPLVNGSNGWVLALNEDGTTSWVDNGFTEITWNDIQSKPETINVLPQNAGSNNQYFVMQNGVATWRYFDGSVSANSPLAPAGSAVHAFLNSHISTIALHVPQNGNTSDVLMKTPGGIAFMPLPQNADTATMADSALYASSAGKLANSVNIGNAPFDGTANVTIQQIGAASSSHSHSNDAWFSNVLVSKMTIPSNPISGKVLAVDETGSGFEWIYVNTADSATYASSAGSAISAGYAISAGIATSANYASSAGNVGNGVITLQIDGASVGVFSMNQSADSTINITGGSIDSSVLESYANGIEMSLNNNIISTVLKNGNTSLGNMQTITIPLDNFVSNTRTVNGKALSSDVVIYGSDIFDSANGSNINAIFDGISQKVSRHVNNSNVHVPEFGNQNNGYVLSVSGGALLWTSTVVVDSTAVLPHFEPTDSGKALMVNNAGDGIEWGIVSGGGNVGSGVITMQAGGTSIGSFNVNTSNNTSINIPVATNDSYGVVKIETMVSNTSNAVTNSVVYEISEFMNMHVESSIVHVPTNGTFGQVLKINESGVPEWGTDITDNGSSVLPEYDSSFAGKILQVKNDGTDVEWADKPIGDMTIDSFVNGNGVVKYAESAANVNDGKIIIQLNGTSKGEFTVNQSINSVVNIDGVVLSTDVSNYVPISRMVNGKELVSNITIYGSDILDSANGSNLNSIITNHTNLSAVHVPSTQGYDNGKVLKIVNGSVNWDDDLTADGSAVLPEYDSNNIGQILQVASAPETGIYTRWAMVGAGNMNTSDYVVVGGNGVVLSAGNATTVNGHTVSTNIPANAVFTDTIPGSAIVTFEAGGTSIGSFSVNESNNINIDIPVATNDSYGVVKVETIVSNTTNAVANSVVSAISSSFSSHFSDSMIHIPIGGTNGQVLKIENGSPVWGMDLIADGSTIIPLYSAGDSGLALVVNAIGDNVEWGVPISATYAGTAIELSQPIVIGNATVNAGSSVTVSDIGAASAIHSHVFSDVLDVASVVHSHVVSDIVGFDSAVSAIIGNGGSGDAYPNRLFVIGDTRTNDSRCNGTYYRIASTYNNLPVYCKDSSVTSVNDTGKGYIMYLDEKWRIIDDKDMYDTPGYYYYLSDTLTGFYYNGNWYYDFSINDYISDSNSVLSNLFVSETDFSILSNYYMKSEIDSRFNSIDTTNYYTKNEIDSMISSNIGNIESALLMI